MKRPLLVLAVLLSMMFFASSSYAVTPAEILPDAQLEQRARIIGQELRCLVCQNQSIDDSDAELAHDLRVLVRQRLSAGDSDAQVKAYIVARYGDYVLLNPPFKAMTVALWLGPLFFLLGAGGLWLTAVKQHKQNAEAAPLTEQEQKKIRALLAEQDQSGEKTS